MPQNRVTMRKIREILRLAWSCKQTRLSISDSCGIGKTTVTGTLYRASAAGLSYPLPADLMMNGWNAFSILNIHVP
jgi:hypothetical protein